MVRDTTNNTVAITLHFQLCAACYTALQMKNTTRRISAINPVTMENSEDSNSHYKCREAIAQHYYILIPCAVSKDKWVDTGMQVHEACIVRTAVCQKAPVKLK